MKGIDVPLVKQDTKGLFRDILVREMSKSPTMHYASDTARYELKVEFVKDLTENIGFSYEKDKETGEYKDKLIPEKQMRILTLKASLYDRRSKETLVDPFLLTTRIDYDFCNPVSKESIFVKDTENSPSILQFSYGQLDSEVSAQASSYKAAYQELAERLVTALQQEIWRFDTETLTN